MDVWEKRTGPALLQVLSAVDGFALSSRDRMPLGHVLKLLVRSDIFVRHEGLAL